MKKTKLTNLIAVGIFMAINVLVPSLTYADSLSYTTDITSGCVSTIEGSSGTKNITVTSGSSVNVTIFNQNLVAGQYVSGPGIPTGSRLGRNNKVSDGFNAIQTFQLGTISNTITIDLTPIPTDGSPGQESTCPIGSNPQSSKISITPVAPVASSTPPANPTKKTSNSNTTPATTPTTNEPTDSTPTSVKTDNTTAPRSESHGATSAQNKKSSKKNRIPLLIIALGLLISLMLFTYFKTRRQSPTKKMPNGFTSKKPKKTRRNRS